MYVWEKVPNKLKWCSDYKVVQWLCCPTLNREVRDSKPIQNERISLGFRAGKEGLGSIPYVIFQYWSTTFREPC